jgi:hypothetical protein
VEQIGQVVLGQDWRLIFDLVAIHRCLGLGLDTIPLTFLYALPANTHVFYSTLRKIAKMLQWFCLIVLQFDSLVRFMTVPYDGQIPDFQIPLEYVDTTHKAR